jgi:alpha-beta hydrolase superfamily lysophospholipase
MIHVRNLLLFLAGCLAGACAPHFESPGAMKAEPRLTETEFISYDGTGLPLRSWMPAVPPAAVIVALHGYNDYSAFIAGAAEYFTGRGIGVYAYDQRGFGASPNPGRWAGHETLSRDLLTFIPLVRQHHPGTPVYILGDSMGGALALTAGADDPLPAAGTVLLAPAVWARETMPFYQRWALWMGARLLPWLKVSPEGLDITPSDNEKMLARLARDPLVLKKSRIDSLSDLADLMDAAYAAASGFDGNVLFLYGIHDEIIPAMPMARFFGARLRGSFSGPQRILIYDDGYHMLLRDLQAEVVWNDFLLWLDSPDDKFPSVREGKAFEIKTEEDIGKLFRP